MHKKILILNGSPRKNGNTSALCDAFSEGAQDAGHSVTPFDLQQMHIHGCLGCLKGGKDMASPCVQKDDMDKIYPIYQEADMVVLASPMYFWSFSGQLKTVIDRLFAVAEGTSNYQNPVKDCVLLMAAEDDSESNWKPVLHYYEALVSHLQWKDCGKVLAGNVMNVGDIHKPARQHSLAEARALGLSIL